MNLLQINKYYPPVIGGIESVTKDIAEGLPAEGIQVHTLVCRHKNEQTSVKEPNLIRARTWFTLLRMPISFSFFQEFKRLIKEADAVLLHHPFPLGFLAYLLFGKRKPLVVFYHSDIVRQRIIATWIQKLFTTVLNRANVIITTSKRLAEYSPLLNHRQKKVEVVSLWVNKESLKPTPERLTTAQQMKERFGEPIILAVGRLVPYKGYTRLLEAMQQIDGNLIIIGEGPLHDTLQKQATTLKVEHKVRLLNHVSDLAPYYYAADLFVLPSTQRSEAFGIVQLEAMYCGLPVVNTNLTTGVPEVSLHEQTGLTVEVDNAQALADAINTLLNTPEQRERYATQAKQRASTLLRHTQLSNLAQILKHL